MVDNLCAMMTVVLPFIALSNASCTIDSLSLSKADVASSSKRIFGSLIRALAMAILCFCPPLNKAPRDPTSVS